MTIQIAVFEAPNTFLRIYRLSKCKEKSGGGLEFELSALGWRKPKVAGLDLSSHLKLE